jgi:hypothetical protein
MSGGGRGGDSGENLEKTFFFFSCLRDIFDYIKNVVLEMTVNI